MRNLSLLLGSWLVLCINCNARVERSISAELIEERVDGKLFTYRLEVVSGSSVETGMKEQWLVNGASVDRCEYEQQLDTARLEELRREREKEHQARIAKHEFKLEQRVLLTKKLLKKLAQEAESLCQCFDRYGLASYIAYGPATFSSEIDFLNIPTYLLEPARQLALCHDSEFSFGRAEELMSSLQGCIAKLELLFEQTVRRAIEQCDDTQHLKRLLELVS